MITEIIEQNVLNQIQKDTATRFNSYCCHAVTSRLLIQIELGAYHLIL
ncbi:hypothetical protein [Acinetobacter sp. ANC 4470]|nr:hypothetical protein [Acinetobacter sp. ANC 4470]